MDFMKAIDLMYCERVIDLLNQNIAPLAYRNLMEGLK